MTFESRGIYSFPTPHGAACIAGTELPVWVLVALRHNGYSTTEMLRIFNNITNDDINNAFAYAYGHSEEINKYLRAMNGTNKESSGCGCLFLVAGAAMATCLSWATNKSIVWAIVHGLCNWFYVIYFIIIKSLHIVP